MVVNIMEERSAILLTGKWSLNYRGFGCDNKGPSPGQPWCSYATAGIPNNILSE